MYARADLDGDFSPFLLPFLPRPGMFQELSRTLPRLTH